MKSYQVQTDKHFDLKNFDADDQSLWKDGKKSARNEIKKLREKLIDLQQVLYAENKHKLLIILQAMDTGGKDGTIRSIFKGINPQGVNVASFKTPTIQELAHDYLWRIHQNTPGNGEIVIFNRSQYEDVLVVRVHEMVPEKVWKKRFQQISNFERLLADEGTTILKFFLFISKEEQKKRFIERLENPDKQWKFNPKDIDERNYWESYMQAYQDVLDQTSTKYAPWYVIPSNSNWYRDLIISKVIVESLEKLGMAYPQPTENIQQYVDLLNKE
jgi:PPK2 family polyphosphate:nucleotide phosphotransferase